MIRKLFHYLANRIFPHGRPTTPTRRHSMNPLRLIQQRFRAALTGRLRGRPAESGRLVQLDEIVGLLGWRGQRQLGLQTIRLDTIVGTTGARRDFDRCFRPTSSRVRSRWERLALAQRRGEAIPPIEVHRLGGLHFVTDGHHRVSIAAATGQQPVVAGKPEPPPLIAPPAWGEVFQGLAEPGRQIVS